MSNSGYKMYTRSPEWRAICRYVKRRSRGLCERCHISNAAHVHHLHYRNFGHESPDDLIHLCLTCHGIEHPHHNFKPRPKAQPRTRTNRTRRYDGPHLEMVDGRVAYVETPATVILTAPAPNGYKKIPRQPGDRWQRWEKVTS